jgi:two-component system sensor histidine kinase KdpD
VYAALVVALATLVASPVAPALGLEAVGMLYLLGIMVVALRLYRGPAFFASLLSVAAFDFFFVPPFFTFAVKDPRHLLTFAVMFAVGLVISSLTVRVRREEEAARGRELERIRLEHEAEQARLRARTEELRSALLSAVSHDLRTPLSTITGAATRLRDDPGAEDPAERAALVGSICDEAARLEHLLANLLDMTKLEAGALEVNREWVPIEEVIGAALTRLEDALGARPVALEIPADVPLVALDPVLFAQVFVNLLENAIKYTPAGTEIAIAVRSAAGDVEIEVADRGPGVPESDVERIFERFVRGRRSGAAGFGLGLANCRGIIEAHGGSISVCAREGGGASFRLRLAAGERPPAIDPELPASSPHGGSP